MNVEKKAHKNLFLVALLIFLAEYLGIIGYYWLFGGHAGDATLTISRYVGLNPLSCAVFCICNLAIAVLMFWHLALGCSKRGFIWRFLMYAFTVAFLALSISPHLPDESMPADIHRFFAGAMFVIMALVSLHTLSKSQRKFLTIYSLLFLLFAVFFIICDVARLPWFMSGIFWYESAYIFAFFGLILPEPSK